MTTLAARPVEGDQLDLLQTVADDGTPLHQLRKADFRRACEAVADTDGWVNPNDVSAWLHARWGEINPRSYSGFWAGACGPNGFMQKTDRLVAIDPRHSRGNANKDVKYRRLRTDT